MPRSSNSGSERPQRVSPRGPHPLRTSSSDTDHSHHRPIADRSPKVVGNRRSPSGATSQPDPVNQKKLGTRIADLESQLGQAQNELKNLKQQLSSAEAEKKEAQEKLENKSDKKTKAAVDHPIEETRDSPDEFPDETQKETDVFEVPVQKIESDQPVDLLVQPLAISDLEKPSFTDLALKDEEINALKEKLAEKENKLGELHQENASLKTRLDEETSNISSIKAKEEETSQKLRQVADELEASKINATQLKEKLELLEGTKSELETEMKKMRVQTEQWRKAADAAAGILAGGVDMNGRIPERCGSMDKHYGGVFEPVFVGSPGMADDFDDGNGSGKHKGSGIRMFWKKKGQK